MDGTIAGAFSQGAFQYNPAACTNQNENIIFIGGTVIVVECLNLQMAGVDTVCVCAFSSHSFWTSSSLDVPAGVTQEGGHTGFLIHVLSAVRALIFLARRIQPFLTLVDREVEFCVLTI